MADVATTRSSDTKDEILAAARMVLSEHGYAGLSTRRVADAAQMPMSQIRYHFGSKEGMILALFEDLNAALLDRQHAVFGDPTLPLSKQWDLACDFLEDDIDSGYVRVLQELIAAGWSNTSIREAVVAGLDRWDRLLAAVAQQADKKFGPLTPFTADEIAALVSAMFLGAESQILLGRDHPRIPYRNALRRIGDVIRRLETSQDNGG